MRGSVLSTGPTQATCALDRADYTAPTRQHELYHTDHTDHTDNTDHADHARSGIYLPCLGDLDHEL